MKTQTILALLMIIIPLASYAGEEESFILIFNNYNEALKNADIQALDKYLVNIQMSGIRECIAHPSCGGGSKAEMKKGALSKYSIINYVEYAKGGRVVNIMNENAKIDKVNGPAVQLYYEGVEVSGFKGKGHATFIVEDGVWKISMTTWGLP